MEYAVQLFVSFVATACFGIVFNVPLNRVLYCGVVGAFGWLVYYEMTLQGVDAVKASFFGAFIVAIIAHVLARKYKTPIIVFNVAGIIPLVPGGIAYNAMRSAVENDYLQSLQFGAKAFLISGAIAMGLVFAEVIVQLFLRSLNAVRLKFGRKKEKC